MVMMHPPKLIAFVSGGIGDQLYHFTQMRALAGITETNTIDVGCIHAPMMRRIAAGCDWLGQVIDISPLRRLAAPRGVLAITNQLRQTGYSDAWFMHKSGNFKLAAWLAGISGLHGLSATSYDKWFLTTPVALEGGGCKRTKWGHRPFIAALDDSLSARGLELDEQTPTIRALPEWQEKVLPHLAHLPRPFVVANLFASDPARIWPIEHAVITLKMVLKRFGGSIIVNTGPDAQIYHEQLCRELIEPGMTDRIVDTNTLWHGIEQDIALYHIANAYLGVDSFSANLAMNCNLNAAVLFRSEGDALDYRGRNTPLVPVGCASGHTEHRLTDISCDVIISSLATLLES